MIGLRRVMQRYGGSLPWLLALVLALVACEGPNSVTRTPVPRKQETSTPPDKGQAVYRPGMPGVIQKATDLVKQQLAKYDEAKASNLDHVVFASLAQQTLTEHKFNIAAYQEMAEDMKKRGIADEMVERLAKQQQEYQKQYDLFHSYLSRLTEDNRSAQARKVDLERFQTFLQSVQPRSHQTPLDPNNLPRVMLAPVDRTPMLSTKGYADFLGLPEMPEGIPIAAPTQDDTKGVEETVITPGIQTLGDQLKTPLAIFKWVRQNIDFYPNYGSIQGADYCRQTRKCNAFDTSSLLIALLRSQKIAARYVFGTVEVPIERARNWAGRFTDKSSEAVGRALASGGIPATTVYTGGKPEWIQMEHVWVEAWVDYVPSRGRVHVEGDTWVPLDATFKQHKYIKGVDLGVKSGVDIKKPIEKARDSVKKDTLDGAINAPDSKDILDTIKKAQTNLKNAVEVNKLSGNELLGGREVLPFEHDVLLASLPYTVKVVGQRVSELPSKVRHTMQLAVVTRVAPKGPWGFGGDPAPDFRTTIPLYQIAGKSLALAYNPASQVDQDTLEKYTKSAQTPGQLPKALPSTLQFKPVITLDGKVLATGNATRLGSDNRFNIDMKGPGINKRISNTIVAGTYNAVVMNPGAIAQEHAKKLQKIAEEVEQKLKNKQVQGLERHKTFGTLLQAGGLNYWFQQDMNARISAEQQDILDIRQPAVGLFGYDLSVTYSGFIVATPRSVKDGGFSTDIDHDPHAIVSYHNDKKAEVRYMSSTGIAASAWEASTWEALLRPANPSSASGVSSMHLLSHAAKNNIPVYSIKKSNINSILPKLSLSAETINDIRSAVAAGKTVVTSQKEMQKGNWKGVGYIVQDEQTGAAGYLISGGRAGGGNEGPCADTWVCSFVLGILMIVAGAFFPALTAFLVAAGVIAALVDLMGIMGTINNSSANDNAKDMARGLAYMLFAIAAAITVLGIWFGALAPFVAIAIYYLVMSIIVAAIIDWALNDFNDLVQNRGTP